MCVSVESRELVSENERTERKNISKIKWEIISRSFFVCVQFTPSLTTFLPLIKIMTSNYVNVKRWMLDTAINRFKDKWSFFLLSLSPSLSHRLPRDNNQFFRRHSTSVFGGVEHEWKCLVNLFPVNYSIDLIHLIIAYWFQVSFWKSYGNEIYDKKIWLKLKFECKAYFWRNEHQVNGIFSIRLVYARVVSFILPFIASRSSINWIFYVFVLWIFIFHRKKKNNVTDCGGGGGKASRKNINLGKKNVYTKWTIAKQSQQRLWYKYQMPLFAWNGNNTDPQNGINMFKVARAPLWHGHYFVWYFNKSELWINGYRIGRKSHIVASNR